MDKKRRNRTIINILTIVTITIVFLIINIQIDIAHKQRLFIVPDGSKYCYGIDSLDKEGNSITIKGWFFELKRVQRVEQIVSDNDTEQMLALVPIGEDVVREWSNNAVFLKIKEMKTDRQDINKYFSCEYDYSKCGFTATVDIDDLSFETNIYRLVFKPDAMRPEGILLNVYLTVEGLMYTNPLQSPILDTVGTDLDKIVNEGVRLVSRPDYGCFVYQLGDKLYWIMDEGYSFCEDGATLIQYQMETTQIDNLPKERLDNDWFWSNNSDMFEKYEITNQMNCGKYRVSVREIPKEYSVTFIQTGYNNGEWIWSETFKPCYAMII